MSTSHIDTDPSESSVQGARAWFARRGLTRPRRGRWLAGVCAAFARRYDWNPLVVRLLVIASIVVPGSQALAYIALWVLMPRDPTAGEASPEVPST